MREKQSNDDNTDHTAEVNGCDSAANDNPVPDNFAIDKTPTLHDQKNEKADVEVMFRSRDCARKYQSQVEAFLKNLLSNGETYAVKTPFTSVHRTQELDESSNVEILESPAIRTPSNSEPVIYTSPFTALLSKTDKAEPKAEIKKRQRFTCFNCLGDHHLKDCPEAHDGYRISTNRRDFFEMVSPCRYHADESLSFNGGNLHPGVISDNLRNALNLKPNQIPPYIYTMRLLGYPPGWLLDAQLETSGISLFDSEKRAEEVDLTGEIKDDLYDGNKFIKYPGFNCSLPEGVTDEWKAISMPPMQSHQMLTEALKHNLVTTTASNVYKRRRLECTNSDAKKDDKVDSAAEKCESPSVSKINSDEKTDSQASPAISVIQGVPIVDTPHLETELPDANKFSTGITEHLNFENLPDAVGKFEKVRTALGQVRQRLTKDN